MITLNALPDDFNLNALGDTDRSSATNFFDTFFLTDPQGNFLTDPQGNFLMGYVNTTVYPQIVHANQDVLNLHSE